MGNSISNKITIHGGKREIHELLKKVQENNNDTFLSALIPLPLGGNIPIKCYEEYFYIFQISDAISDVTDNSFSFWVNSKNKPPYSFFDDLVSKYDDMNIIMASDDYLAGVSWICIQHNKLNIKMAKEVGWQENYVTNRIFYNLQYFLFLKINSR